MPDSLADTLAKALFADPAAHVYAVLDGAAIPGLLAKAQECHVEPVCLYRGKLTTVLAAAAPYQVTLERGSPFMNWLFQEGWGKHWGVFAVSRTDWRPMREHLCSLTQVYDPDYQPIYFRYYDPRVLRVYLPTCDAGELRTVFGPIARLLCEDEDGALLRFWIAGRELGSDRLPLQ